MEIRNIFSLKNIFSPDAGNQRGLGRSGGEDTTFQAKDSVKVRGQGQESG